MMTRICIIIIISNVVITCIVHRIGRTGRSGKTGIATTFINMGCSEQILLDLKHLLREANQRIPPVLLALDDPMDHISTSNVPGGKLLLVLVVILLGLLTVYIIIRLYILRWSWSSYYRVS
jgi:hypothetical protein